MWSDMQKLLGNLEKGLLFVISAPAGTGKTTLVQRLMDEFPCIIQSVSYTTRKKRPNEEDGVHYLFIDRKTFEDKILAGDFLEYAEIYGEYYGTSLRWEEEQRRQGNHVVLVIDTQGAMKVKEKCAAVFIFIKPPSLEVLQERLENRGTEQPRMIEHRMSWAKQEIEAAKKYDYMIINQELEVAYQVLRSIFIAEEHKKM